MGKGSIALGIIALIISLGVGGFIIFDRFFLGAQPATEENQWYDTNEIAFFMPPSEALGALIGIGIDFEVKSGQKVYFSFITEIIFDSSSDPASSIDIYFEIDGIKWTKPNIRVSRFNITSSSGLWMTASVQHYNNTMAEGLHYATMLFKGSSTADAIWHSSLFIRTFN